MRKALFGILMAATAAMPVIAQAQETDTRDERRAARSEEHYRQMGERNEARSERRQEAQTERVERQQARQERVEAPVQQQQSWGGRRGGDGQRSQAWSGGDRQRTEAWSGSQRSERWGGRGDTGQRDSYRRQIEASREASEVSADQTIGGNYARQADRNQQRYEERVREDGRDGREWNRDGRDWRRDGRDWNRDGRSGQWSGNRYGDRRDHRSSWNRGWRNDNRYDWQRYRYANRDRFRVGSYYSPYRNHRYNRLSIGLFLDSLFFSNRYWLNDPWQYRLPPAPYGTQWVRYYDDVVLVDVYTGEVLDVIYDFFW